MSTQRCGTAACDGQQHLFVLAVDPLATALNEGLSCIANDVGHLQRRPVHALCVCSPSPRMVSASSGLPVALRCRRRDAGRSSFPPGRDAPAASGWFAGRHRLRADEWQSSGAGMGMDVLVFKAGALRGLLTGVPENLGGDRITCCMPSVAGKQPVGGLALQPAPVDAQGIEQLGAEHNIAVLASLASRI